MRLPVTPWHILLSVLFVSTACSSSRNVDGDGGVSTDAPPRAPDGPWPCDSVFIEECARGACCDDVTAPVLNPITCVNACPAGYSPTCEVDPAALCGPTASCEDNDECVLESATCCGTCDVPTLDDVTAVHRDGVDTHRRNVCGDDPPACPPCAPPSPNPYLIAFCAIGREDGGHCRAIDLRTQTVTSCEADTDCHVRARACCECGADTSFDNLIAVSDPAGYARFACGRDVACPECAPIYPDDVEAFCDDGGTCALRNLAAPTPFP